MPPIKRNPDQARVSAQLRRQSLHRLDRAEDKVENKVEAQKQKHEQASQNAGTQQRTRVEQQNRAEALNKEQIREATQQRMQAQMESAQRLEGGLGTLAAGTSDPSMRAQLSGLHDEARELREGQGQLRELMESTPDAQQQIPQMEGDQMQPSPQVQGAVNAVNVTVDVHVDAQKQGPPQPQGPNLRPGEVQSSVAQSMAQIEALGQSMGPHIEGM